MLDVHPAHHSASTWRDFFIHIATIVIGLLIAIGLEQTVELIHHRREVAETREALAEERQKNREIYRQHLESYLREAAALHNNFRVFSYLQQHPKTALAACPASSSGQAMSSSPSPPHGQQPARPTSSR